MNMDVRSLEAYIRQAAAARGIDPDIAVRVAKSEGLAPGVWQSNVKLGYGRERSYGPFQLHLAPSGHRPGLGNKFMQQTGLDPSDPSNVYKGIDFALDHAANNGWGAWFGAKAVGVSPHEGIGGKRPMVAEASYHPPEGNYDVIPTSGTPDKPQGLLDKISSLPQKVQNLLPGSDSAPETAPRKTGPGGLTAFQRMEVNGARTSGSQAADSLLEKFLGANRGVGASASTPPTVPVPMPKPEMAGPSGPQPGLSAPGLPPNMSGVQPGLSSPGFLPPHVDSAPMGPPGILDKPGAADLFSEIQKMAMMEQQKVKKPTAVASLSPPPGGNGGGLLGGQGGGLISLLGRLFG